MEYSQYLHTFKGMYLYIYHEVLGANSVSIFEHRYDTEQCARGAAKPQGMAKVCSSVHCMHLRWEVTTFVIDDEQSTYFQMKI